VGVISTQPFCNTTTTTCQVDLSGDRWGHRASGPKKSFNFVSAPPRSLQKDFPPAIGRASAILAR
jgi:hypothetical protein